MLLLLPLISVTAAATPPSLTSFYPLGAARGAMVTVTASGTFERWPVRAWVSGPGLTFEAGEEKGKLTAKVADDAVPGIYWVRLFDEQGASPLRPFRVGHFPDLLEVEPNDAPEKAQRCEALPIAIHGKFAKRGDVDSYSVTLKAGETLVASLEGQRLGSPMDAVLQVASSDGLVLSQAEDSVGLDPLLAFRAPRDDRYLVRAFAFPATPDSTIGFAGGDAFLYRLSLTTGPFLDHPQPMAVRPNGPSTIDAVGWGLPEGLKLMTQPMAEPGLVRVWGPELDQSVDVPILNFPHVFTGLIDQPKRANSHTLAANKGQSWRVRVMARSLGSPLDAALRVLGPAGMVLAEQDDAGNRRDPEVSFKAGEEGTYKVEVRDVTDQAGPRHFYRLEMFEPKPDFAPTLADDRVVLIAGKSVEVKVTLNRLDGLDGPIEVRCEGLPEGVTAEPVVSEGKGASAKEVKIVLKAPAESSLFQGTIGISGNAKVGEANVERHAQATINGFEQTTSRVWLTVGKP